MKDFYDVWALSETFQFGGAELQEADRPLLREAWHCMELLPVPGCPHISLLFQRRTCRISAGSPTDRTDSYWVLRPLRSKASEFESNHSWDLCARASLQSNLLKCTGPQPDHGGPELCR